MQNLFLFTNIKDGTFPPQCGAHIFEFVVRRSFTAALEKICHTTLGQGVSARHNIHVSCACVFDLSSTLSSQSSFVSPIFYFILLIFHFIFYVDRFGAKPSCALPRMRSLALWSTTFLSGYEPNFFVTTTSQRPLKFSSRSPPATPGPRTCMTRRSVTRPSVERSLHHCSLRSGTNQRAVDKLITLLKKVCCQVSRCLSVM